MPTTTRAQLAPKLNLGKTHAIVLGARREGAFTGSATHIPGSIAHQIISNAPCPVLTIRGDHEGNAR